MESEMEQATVTYTPGPWHAKPRGTKSSTWEVVTNPTFREVEIVAEAGHVIADLRWNGKNEGPAGLANAHLLAAAPEMLKALESALNVLEVYLPGMNICKSVIPKVRAAVAKAKGEAA
jgi:hypothetical protein